jgi:DNA helicase-2/ATP-dependent DNA helicase PcrA
MTKILESLNKKQKEAAFWVDGSSLILAGAGSGKTRVLVAKVIYLIKEKKVSPSSIVMITFTNKAASEMKERIKQELGDFIHLGYIGTFHSFAALILRRFWKEAKVDKNFLIYDEDEQTLLIKNILKKEKIEKKSPSYFLYYISYAKNRLILPENFLENFSFYQAASVADIYFRYQEELDKNRALDFDDLLLKAVLLLKNNSEVLDFYHQKYDYFLVDEFQDTNFIQYELTKILGMKKKKVTVVGDFSQSIYSWRGAEIENLNRFQKDFTPVSVFHLEKNYRSTQKILDFAYKIISKNSTHPLLRLYTEKEGGEEIFFYEGQNEEDEAVFVAEEITKLSKNLNILNKNIAVLYRTNAQSRVIEEVFLHYGIPYILIGGIRFYARKEIKDVLAFLRLLINPTDEPALNRLKDLGKKRFLRFRDLYEELKDSLSSYSTNELIDKIFEATDYLSLYDRDNEEDFSRLENIRELKSVATSFPNLIDFLQQVALVESEYFEDEKKNDTAQKVRLMTLHQAKGLEFDYVFIVGVEEGILPHSRSLDDPSAIEEERRLFYVGITRAKEKLYITYTKKRFIFGKQNYSLKSRFLEENVDTL